MTRDYIVFSQRLAGYLMMNGYQLRKLRQTNKPNSNRNVFVFYETDDLLGLVDKYKANK